MGQRLVFPLRRLGHLSREEFQAYWFDHHAPLVASVADTLGIVGYQQVHTRFEARSTTVPCFDGVAELWFDPAARAGDRDAVAAASQLLLDDERTFIDLPASPLWMAEEDVHLAGPTEGLRMTAVLRRHPSITRDEFRRHWSKVHGPWALRHPEVFGFRHYTQLHTPADADDSPIARARQAPPAFDGVSVIHRDPPTASAEAVAALRAEFHEDEQSFLDVDASPVFFGEVRVILGEQEGARR
ncbi:MAG: EthD domain-containing protein [Acidimicrobiales bacterium]